MFGKIEKEYKEKTKYIWRILLLILFIFIYLLSIIISIFLFESDILKILFSIFILIISSYIFIVIVNIKNKVYPKKEFFKIFYVIYSINKFKEWQKTKNKKVLKEVLKKHGVNTRPKVANILDHYRNQIPKNINEHVTFIAIMSLTFSFITFCFDESLNFLQNKLSIIISICFIAIILYSYISIINMSIISVFSKHGFYIELEDLLTEIYINSEIK